MGRKFPRREVFDRVFWTPFAIRARCFLGCGGLEEGFSVSCSGGGVALLLYTLMPICCSFRSIFLCVRN